MSILLVIDNLPSIRFIDVVDILLVALLLYEIYKLIRGTNALKIFVGIFSIFIISKIVQYLDMRILSEILGQFISVGVVLLIIVFHPEIRKFLFLLGSRSILSKSRGWKFWRKIMNTKSQNTLTTTPIIQACQHMANSQTGALIIIGKENLLESIIATGEVFESEISSQLLETIFFKNSPLHDGAVVIVEDKIRAARCIIPISSQQYIPSHMGLRHRSAVGVTEQYDCVAIVVSEQTGGIAYAKGGRIESGLSPVDLQQKLDIEFNHKHKK